MTLVDAVLKYVNLCKTYVKFILEAEPLHKLDTFMHMYKNNPASASARSSYFHLISHHNLLHKISALFIFFLDWCLKIWTDFIDRETNLPRERESDCNAKLGNSKKSNNFCSDADQV